MRVDNPQNGLASRHPRIVRYHPAENRPTVIRHPDIHFFLRYARIIREDIIFQGVPALPGQFPIERGIALRRCRRIDNNRVAAMQNRLIRKQTVQTANHSSVIQIIRIERRALTQMKIDHRPGRLLAMCNRKGNERQKRQHYKFMYSHFGTEFQQSASVRFSRTHANKNCHSYI